MTVPSAPPPPPPDPPRGRPRSLIVLLWAVTGTVLIQASLAGLFLSGLASTRLAHTVVGWLLPYAAIAIAAVAGVCHNAGTCPPRLAIAIYPLPVLLWIQEVLGHVPFPASTAVHVPLGVALTVYPAVLAVLLTTRGSTSTSG